MLDVAHLLAYSFCDTYRCSVSMSIFSIWMFDMQNTYTPLAPMCRAHTCTCVTELLATTSMVSVLVAKSRRNISKCSTELRRKDLSAFFFFLWIWSSEFWLHCDNLTQISLCRNIFISFKLNWVACNTIISIMLKSYTAFDVFDEEKKLYSIFYAGECTIRAYLTRINQLFFFDYGTRWILNGLQPTPTVCSSYHILLYVFFSSSS